MAATNRASFYLYTLPEEIDRLVDGLHKARKDPAWLGDGVSDLYREVILDHYKNPRGHGVIEDADAQAEGMNPLCGDEVTIYVAVRGRRRDDRRGEVLRARLRDQPGGDLDADGDGQGRNGRARSPALPKEELLEEIGIPLTPIRLKCALLGPGRAQGRAPPGQGNAAARRVGRPRRARAEVALAWPSSTSRRSTSSRPAR